MRSPIGHLPSEDELGDLEGSGPEDRGLLRGIHDWLRLEGHREEVPRAPAQFVRLVLRLCRMNGMSQRDFGRTVGDSDNLGRPWQRYYRGRARMETGKLRAFLMQAQAAGWLDRVREAPKVPHPSEFPWGASGAGQRRDESCKQWMHYERPPNAPELFERLAAIEACARLNSAGREISLDAVRQVALVDLDIEGSRWYRQSARSAAQRMRRAREEHGDAYWVPVTDRLAFLGANLSQSDAESELK